MSEVIAVGCDVSKGRMDVVVQDHSRTVLDGSGPYDDTHGDHTRLRELLRWLVNRYPLAEIRVAAESTGGYERNWLHTIRDERRRAPASARWRLNPLAVKKWLDSDLHRAVDDVHAAHGIAAFLLARRQTPWRRPSPPSWPNSCGSSTPSSPPTNHSTPTTKPNGTTTQRPNKPLQHHKHPPRPHQGP